MTKVYKVYDDEWEEIMGKGQVIEFAIDQIRCNFGYEDLINNDYDLCNDANKTQKKILEKIFNGEKISFAEAKKILPIRTFDIEEINVY